nr:alpha-ketoglutarate dehydrogenase [Pseudomonas sp. UFMG81]
MMNPNEPLTPLDAALDSDPAETEEWCQALASTLAHCGAARARYLLQRLQAHALELGLEREAQAFSAYRNTLPVEQQGAYPGDLELDERITGILRWNALAMVVRANHAYGELGGHIASYASAAEIFEVGFQHFFRGESGGEQRTGDLVFFQPHSAPGIYARAFLEGRLSEQQLANYRQEVAGNGLCSYPHPWLMPDFWQFPTGSMGIGPLNAIYQARFMRYLQHRGLLDTSGRHVWGVFGDGEMDEPESTAGLTLAAREGLDNLTFIVNCNLQRLDGPVRGNGQIIQELEALFSGAGWNVIKVLWGSEWDALFARDHEHALLRQLAATPDGQFQTLGAKDGSYNLEHFFNQAPALQRLVAHMSSDEINALKRGGHDFRKLHAAYAAAKACKGRPTVILAKTKKGYGMSSAGESRMTAHQAKKLDVQALLAFRDRFHLPLSDEAVEQLRFYRPAEDSPEMVYLRQRRAALGGALPIRRSDCATLPLPELDAFAGFALHADGKEMSTTMAAVRLLGHWLKAPGLGPRVVPIVADEARTFGMASLFRQIGIYSPAGQRYEPEDAGSLLVYKEARDGQLLEEGITEAGAISSWVAAATSYAVHGEPMLPVYIYYSMFGFQRVGDLIWAAADQRARGLLLGATAGRTTLGGEGLQHQDGSSLVMASMVPNCRAWDPCFAGELALILDHAARRMLVEQRDEFHYVAVMNENYPQPSLPDGVREAVLRGMYLYTRQQAEQPRGQVRLLGSGTILREVIAAGELLVNEWQVDCEVFSVTSFSELARDARDARRSGIAGEDEHCHLRQCLPGDAPVIAASDYVRAWPQLIAEYVQAPYITLGTDGFGRSDTRQQLRRFFEVDRYAVVMAALYGLVRQGRLPKEVLAQAQARYAITDEGASWYR